MKKINFEDDRVKNNNDIKREMEVRIEIKWSINILYIPSYGY